MAKFKDHDSYIVVTTEQFRPLLVQLRRRLAEALPDAEELIMYDMPGFGFGTTIIAGYAAFSKQCGLYVSKGAIAAHAEEIASPVSRPPRPASHSRQAIPSPTN